MVTICKYASHLRRYLLLRSTANGGTFLHGKYLRDPKSEPIRQLERSGN
jgi:hypothetical protein